MDLTRQLSDYISDKDARIGIAVISPEGDTVSVNAYAHYPMLSVYKFPQALAVADYCIRHGLGFSDTVSVSSSELLPDTYSPMRERYGAADIDMTISELLAFSIQLSDNNACDILFRMIGGTSQVDSFLTVNGYTDIHVLSTEAEMHSDPDLCYANTSTPVAMARLVADFHDSLRHSDSRYLSIDSLMRTCRTGYSRLAMPLTVADDTIAHKTGTGDINCAGRIIGVNDVGYITLADGAHYTIVVFVADSAYPMEQTEQIIGDISAIAHSVFRKN